MRVLHMVANPDVAYVLFVLGLLGVLADLHLGAVGLAGIAGAVALALAVLGMFGFGAPPASAVALALLVSSIALVVAELHVQAGGLLGAIGLVLFVVGSVQLFHRAGATVGPHPAPHPAVVAATTAVLFGVVFGVFRAFLRTRRMKPQTGEEALVGAAGIAETDLAPTGRVRVEGEAWTARAAGTPLARGEEIEVIGVEGVTLMVRRADAFAHAYRGGSSS